VLIVALPADAGLLVFLTNLYVLDGGGDDFNNTLDCTVDANVAAAMYDTENGGFF
jgi:hypothetical protein